MTQEHSLPTQKELDAFIFEAKALRQKTIVALTKRLFHLPMGLKRRANPTIKVNLVDTVVS